MFNLKKYVCSLFRILLRILHTMCQTNNSMYECQTSFRTPGLLSQFIADLHSGKLHREFHHGPDPTTTPPAPGVCINYSNDLTLR